MKKIFTSILVLLSVVSFAQEFKPFKVNASVGYAIPSGKGAKGGVLFSLEPKYGLTDNIDIGLRYEAAIMARSISILGEEAESEIKGAGSWVLTGTYLVSTNNFRPYVGVGAGLYSSAGVSVSSDDGSATDGSVNGGTKFGGMIRAGFKLGHFNMGVEYNLVPANKLNIDFLGSSLEAKSENSYIGIKIGADIGGGRR